MLSSWKFKHKIALLPSLALPFVYPYITGLFGPSRDYRKAYGLDDILYLWLIAAGLAFVVWAFGLGVRWWARRFWIPLEGDRPLRLFAKYALRPWGNLLRDSATYTNNNNQQQVIVLRDVGDTSLVTPAIGYTDGELTAQQQTDLAALIPRHPFRLYWRIRHTHAGKVTLAYVPQVPLDGPTVVPRNTLAGFTQDKLVREQ